MVKVKWLEKLGATPGKLLVVGGLAIVLVAVIYYQLPSSGQSDAGGTAGTVTKSGERSPAGNNTKRSVAGATTEVDQDLPQPMSEWSDVPLENALAHNPFAVPTALEPPAPGRSGGNAVTVRQKQEEEIRSRQARERALAMVRERGVQMVLYDEQDRIAVVGNQIVRVGEVLEGFRVVAIHAKGITLSEHEVARN